MDTSGNVNTQALTNFTHYNGGNMNKTEALDWALTYLREALGRDIEDNQEYQEAVKTLKEAV